MEYNFREIEKKWQQQWNESNAYKVDNNSPKPKYYVLDMFPYPSGAGLHVGHPLGYIASDIYSRYKRLKGYNVLHPMGYDAFGLPAEQYAIEHGIHPAESTAQNIANFRRQLDNIGFSYDWSREVKTSDPAYYKWTQWIFLQLFKSWYNRKTNKAESIDELIKIFETEGNASQPCPGDSAISFTGGEWNEYEEKEQQDILMNYRLAYCGEGEVNWCEALGTVLANDEVVNGVSERGGYPVVKKKLRQWYLRITEYAGRLQSDLEKLEWTDAMKEMQTNWIGKSYGAEIEFEVAPHPQNASSGLRPPSPRGEGNTTGKYFQSADNSSWSILKEYGRENRKNQTEAEAILWEELRNNKLGQKVRRQHNINGYIADFAYMESHLVIEVDGGYHNDEEQKTYDIARTALLEERGFTVLRFTNEEVLNNFKSALETIKNTLKSKAAQRKNERLPQSNWQSSTDTPQSITDLEETEVTSQTIQPSNTESPLSERRGAGGEATTLTVYTTRPDTIMGVDFMVVAPEHELVSQITTHEQNAAIDEYIAYVNSRSERERQAEKKITGCFTGAYAINPFNGQEIPIWISEYVLAGYGTGAIMAVPCGDDRDFKFAKHFNIHITNIIGDAFNGEEANATKDAVLSNSGFLDGMPMRKAMEVVLEELEKRGIGRRKTNYRMRDAAFSRQRYWGEPFPIIWKDGIAYPLPESELPLELPYMENIKPGSNGEGPLANNLEWAVAPIPAREPELEGLEKGDKELGVRETNTMPGYAGSSWYFLRYMDPYNTKTFAERKVTDYWNQVDVYIGGTEHAVGHLLYSRMWTKALYDLGHIGFDEPFKKLVNQGMIQGSSRFVYRVNIRIPKSIDPKLFKEDEILMWKKLPFISKKHYDSFYLDKTKNIIKDVLNKIFEGTSLHNCELTEPSPIYVDVNIVDGVELDIEAFKKWRNGEYANAEFILEGGKYICGVEVEKMSKSKLNTQNPDDLVQKYGADTFRMYEMFLGPIEQSKPWDTKGIEGVHRFLKKLWRLFFTETAPLSERRGAGGEALWNDETSTAAELKILHRTIKKIEDDTERFSFNTAVSAFMVCVNELGEIKCHKKAILEPLLIMLTPYAPHVAEELYQQLQLSSDTKNYQSVLDATFPAFEEKCVVESSKEYPVSINGKLRTTLTFPLDAEQSFIEQNVMANDVVIKWTEGKEPKKIIYVKGKMINVVV